MQGKKRPVLVVGLLIVLAAGGYYAFRKLRPAAPGIATAQAVRGDFEVTIKARGEIKALRSVTLVAPTSVTDVQLVRLTPSGTMVNSGDVVVEIDATQESDRLKERESAIRQVDAELEKTRAQQRIQDEADRLDLAQAEFDVERGRLEVRKQEIVSEIEAGKAKLALLNAERKFEEVKERIKGHSRVQAAETDQVVQRRKKADNDVVLAKGNIGRLTIRSPLTGMLQLLPNFRQGGGMFGRGSVPEFKQGDRAWPGAAIAEIPDLGSMAVELNIEETDRGKLVVGQKVRVKVDAFSDQVLTGKIESISPLAQISFTTFPPPKTFRAIVSLDLKGLKLKPKRPQGGPGQPQAMRAAGGGGPGGPGGQGAGAAGAPGGVVAGGAPGGGAMMIAAAPTARPQGAPSAAGAAPAGGGNEVRRVVTATAGELPAGTPGAGTAAAQPRAGAAPGGEQRVLVPREGAPAEGQMFVRREVPSAGGAPQQVAAAGPAPAGGERVEIRRAGPPPSGAMPAAGAAPAGAVAQAGRMGAMPGGRPPEPQKPAPPPPANDTGLRPGMSAGADIVVERFPNVVLIPVRASFDRSGKVFVYVKRGVRFEPREISVGRKNESQIEVTSGLQPGETVALEEPPEAKGK